MLTFSKVVSALVATPLRAARFVTIENRRWSTSDGAWIWKVSVLVTARFCPGDAKTRIITAAPGFVHPSSYRP